MNKFLVFCSLLCVLSGTSAAQSAPVIYPGAYQTSSYLPLLQGKRVAVFANQTSVIGSRHLVDSLLQLGIDIVRIFGPEHGFRGTADAGAHVANYTDKQTGIPVVSLYGKKKQTIGRRSERCGPDAV